MDIVAVEIGTLVPDPENTRVHPHENIEAIKNSLARFGQVLPLVVHAGTLVVVGGNGTLQAMRELDFSQVSVVMYPGSLEEAKALSIALNRTGELAEWDLDALGASLVSLQDSGFDYMALGFSAESLGELFPTAEKVEESVIDFQVETPKTEEAETEGEEVVKQYALLFDNKEQQKRFYSFLRWLKKHHPAQDTVAARLDAHIQEVRK